MNIASAAPIARRALHDELADRMRQLIVEGELQAGARVPEQALCEQFGVSRTPIREALKVLSAEGLVTLVPNRGATVTELTMEDLEEVFPVIGALEGLAGELACKHISDEALVEITQLHAQMVAEYETEDLKAYFRSNEAIHDAIHNAAGNATLILSLRSLSGRVRRARFRANMTRARWTKAIEEHEQILAALTERDGRKLSKLMKLHLANKFQSVRASMKAAAE